MAKIRMTTEEAFVKVLQMHGIEHAFGIIGSAFMPISDLFPRAGITFWDVGHEGNAGMMADGFTRASGKVCMMIAQNGPGITNFVTPVKDITQNNQMTVSPGPPVLVVDYAAVYQDVDQMLILSVNVADGHDPGSAVKYVRFDPGQSARYCVDHPCVVTETTKPERIDTVEAALANCSIAQVENNG